MGKLQWPKRDKPAPKQRLDLSRQAASDLWLGADVFLNFLIFRNLAPNP
jgi:hypothetical protein